MEPLVSATEVAEDRAIAEAQMIDTCRITKPGPGGKGPLDEETGQYTLPARVTVYEGKCRIQVRSDINSNAVEAVVAEHEWTYRTATLQLPIEGTGDVQSDYVAEILSCPFDPSLVGLIFNVQAETKGKTLATHRRFRIRGLMS